MASNNLKISTLKNLDSSILKFHLMKRNDKDKIEKKKHLKKYYIYWW